MTTAQQRRHEILDAKMALEFELMGPLDKIGMDYIRSIEMNGGASLSAHDRLGYQDNLETVLLRHYARTSSVFQGIRPTRATTLESAALSLAHLESLRSRAARNAGLLLRSIDRAWSEAMGHGHRGVDDGTGHYAKSEAKSELFRSIETKDDPVAVKPAQSPTVSYYAKLKSAVSKVVGKFKSNMPAVTSGNTNPVAEQTRELQIVAPKDANGYIEKTWKSLMDGRERDWHHDADEEVVPVKDAFEVGGERLRFPGDSALGASLANLINCRCYLIYTFVNASTGERTELYRSPSAPTRRYRRKPNPEHPVPNFRGPVEGQPLNPTSVVTLNGTTRARIVLGDGKTLATMVQETPNTVVVKIGRTAIARATIRNGTATNIKVDPKFKDQGIEGLLKRSAEHSATMDRRPHEERLPQ